jgi:uncharacterized membrane protein YjjP (DUF1212 family)
MPPPRPPADEPFALLGELTELLLRWSYEGTAGAEAIVRRVGACYDTPARATFLADQATVTVGERVLAFGATSIVPPLDQVSALKRLLAEIDAGRLPVADARRRLAQLTGRPPRFRPLWRVVGMVAFSAGFGASIQATWQEVAASAALGVLVGLLFVAADGRERLTLVAPFAGSVLVSALVLIAFEHDWIDGGPIQLMIPALFIFIPGDALSAAMLELADGRMTAGASRLVASLAVLLMLGFGVLGATVLVDVPRSALFESDVPGNLGPLAVWGAWVVFAVGVLLVFSMAPRDFPWALALMLGTAGVATLGTAAAGEAVGTFLGAVAMTVVALLLGRRPGLPPPYVLYLGAFYILTPGSHGLRGIESWIGGHPIQGITGVAEMLGLLTAIALGMLIGAAAVRRPLAAGT